MYDSGTQAAYEFMFTRALNGVAVTYTRDEGTATYADRPATPWMYERLILPIGDGGVEQNGGDGYSARLTINAIGGTVIDRSVGY